MLLRQILKRIIGYGTVTLIDANGTTHKFTGEGGPSVTLRLHDRALHRRLAIQPDFWFGEAYMDGSLTIEEGTLYDFLDIAAVNVSAGNKTRAGKIYRRLMSLAVSWQHYNPVRLARGKVSHHYDLSSDLFELFLDGDRQYSCAYYTHPDDSLEQAQLQKKRHIAAKLLLKDGQKVLDIGSGWGGMGLYLANIANVDVTGVTLSDEQYKLSNQRANAMALNDRVRFHLRDYRHEKGPYDRIVSVGMFEHVGNHHYDEFFQKVGALLADDGVMLLHSIGQFDGKGAINPWVRKHIFPGAYTPALSEVLPAIERAGLWVTDIEILRLHYADTLRDWNIRFQANRDKARALYDERFCRMWELYLQGCELGFRRQSLMVFQIQLAKSRDAVPLTRDYMIDWERTQAETDKRPRQAAE